MLVMRCIFRAHCRSSRPRSAELLQGFVAPWPQSLVRAAELTCVQEIGSEKDSTYRLPLCISVIKESYSIHIV